MLNIFVTETCFSPWGAATVGSVSNEEKVFVLRNTVEGWYFRTWSWNPQRREPSFHFVSILSCARAFSDRTLAECFKRFLETNNRPCEIVPVESGRLLKPLSWGRIGQRSRE